MPGLATDLLLATQLLERWDVVWWERLADNAMQPLPRVHERDSERVEELLAWAASNGGAQPSFVQSAVANVARVLADFNLALHYEVQYREAHYLVDQWYRRSHGKPSHPADVERFEIHILLIHNLALELCRAVNLVIERGRKADDSIFADLGLMVIHVGPDHSPMQALTYSADQAKVPQPYPGLVGFPDAVLSRAVGGLGFHPDETPRTADEFDRWIVSLTERRGPGSKAPPREKPPFSLPPPRSVDEKVAGRWPRSLAIGYAVLAAFAVGGALLQHPWLLGAALAAAIAAASVVHWGGRWPPGLALGALIALAATGGGVLGQTIADALHGVGRGSSPQAATGALAGDGGRGAGQVIGGNQNLLIANLSRGSGFRNRQHARPCDLLEYRLRLYNPGPGDLAALRVSATINTLTPYRRIVPTVTAYGSRGLAYEPSYQAVIHLPTAQTQSYVTGSTRLLDSAGQVTKKSAAGDLSDVVTAGARGVLIGGLGAGVTEYTTFRTRLSCNSGMG